LVVVGCSSFIANEQRTTSNEQRTTNMDAYLTALRILHYRFNSEGELRRKLRGKKFGAEEIDAALVRLRAEKWLDDERFAGAFVRTRARRRVGPLRIRRELGAAGVDREVIDRALESNADAEGKGAALAELCAKRLRLLARRHGQDFLTTDEARQKVAAYLVNQGYDAGEVFAAIREALRAEAPAELRPEG
jgi:regulatory protein